MENFFFDFSLYRIGIPEHAAQAWQGEGKSGILVVHPSPTLPDQDRDFLAGILKAIDLTPLEEHVFILNCPEGTHRPLSRLYREHDLRHVFIFGVDPARLGIRAQLPTYEFTRLGEMSFLLAHPLPVIRAERAAKKNEKAGALWQALKAKFL